MRTKRSIAASFCKSFVLLSLVTLSVGVSPAHAQVFDSGPSDPALFDTVINLPPAPDIGDDESNGDDGLTTQLNVADGGNVGSFFDAFSGSEVNISGGTVGSFFDAFSGSEVNISGGTVDSFFDAGFGSVVNVSGGNVGSRFDADGSVVNISGGSVGRFFTSDRSVVNISGGNLGDDFNAFFGSEVNISGGNVGSRFDALDRSVVNISGGNLGDDFNASFGSEVNMSGGNVGSRFDALDGSVVNISGGSVGDNFEAFSGSEVNLFGTDFILDGEPLVDLVPGEAFTIVDRNVTLFGRLSDGTVFSFGLSSSNFTTGDFFDTNATLTVTLPDAFFLGDVNQDGLVDFLDIGPFISLLSNGEFQDEADIDRSGVVDFLDIGPFIGLLSL